MQSTPSQAGATAPPGWLRLVVEDREAGRRLDLWLAERLGLGRRASARLVSRALRNGRPTTKGERVASGDEVLAPVQDSLPGGAAAGATVVRVTSEVLVLAKPAGLASVGVVGRPTPSLAAWVAGQHPECATVGAPGECGLAHRLDTGTSGLVLVARCEHAYRSLRRQFTGHAVEKSYLAVVAGEVRSPVRIAVPIGQHPKSRRRVRAVEKPEARGRYSSRDALTEVEPLRRVGSATLVRATTTSGARHQVRVHLAHVGHPLLGDPLYGGAAQAALPGFLLHAERLCWRDPRSDSRQEDRIEPPDSWAAALARLARGLAGD